jgi:DNA-binding NarL/FixJ family response regulator
MQQLVADMGVAVAGAATDCDEAVAMIGESRPDVFIAGIDPLKPNQIACIRRAADVHPGLKSIVVADNTEPEAILGAFSAGASIYCAKTAEQDDLASAIRQLFSRSIYISAADSPTIPHEPRPAEPVSHNLTRRELEILRLVAEGSSNSQLARMLWVTEQTVKFHLSNIYRKLDVTNRTEASRWAQLNGLLATCREEFEPTSEVAATPSA